VAETPPGEENPAEGLLGGRYRLESRIGSGGMGVVYRATDEVLGRTVAIKLFREPAAADLSRKTSETRLLAGLNHPSLVTLYDARIDSDDDAYLVMEYVDGPTLRDRLKDGPVAPVDAARMARDLGEALHVVHNAGVVHRDIKPANVLLRSSLTPGEEFTATLADFGIAHLVGSSRLTTPGTLLGTAAYLSPEQVRGSEPAPASDIYALGLVLLESLTGQRVFAQPAVHEAALARLTLDPEVPGSLGYGWKSLLTAMTAREPEDRPTALEVAAASRNLNPDEVATTVSPAVVATTPDATIAATAAAVVASPTVAMPEMTAAPTQRMPVSDAPTVAMSSAAAAPTQRMAASAAPTVAFDRVQEPGRLSQPHEPSPPGRARRRGLLVAGIGGVAVLSGVLAWSLLIEPGLSTPPATDPATSQVPTGPAEPAPAVEQTGDTDPSEGVDTPTSTDPVVPEPAPAEPTPVEPAPEEPAPAPSTPAEPGPSETLPPAGPTEPGVTGNGVGNGNGKANGKTK
jgi:serine/threonine protein kinase